MPPRRYIFNTLTVVSVVLMLATLGCRKTTKDDASAKNDVSSKYPDSLKTLKNKYAGKIKSGITSEHPMYVEQMELLLGEWDAVGSTPDQIKYVLGPPQGETESKLLYKFENGFTGTAWSFEIENGRIVKVERIGME